jgi:hypothetical protein
MSLLFDFSLGCASRVLVAVLALLSIKAKCFVAIRSLAWMHVFTFKTTLANHFTRFADHHLVEDTDSRHSRLGYLVLPSFSSANTHSGPQWRTGVHVGLS